MAALTWGVMVVEFPKSFEKKITGRVGKSPNCMWERTVTTPERPANCHRVSISCFHALTLDAHAVKVNHSLPSPRFFFSKSGCLSLSGSLILSGHVQSHVRYDTELGLPVRLIIIALGVISL